MKLDGRKVYMTAVLAIITNAILMYFTILPVVFFILSTEALCVVMAFRSTSRKTERKLDELNRKELKVAPDRSVSRWVR